MRPLILVSILALAAFSGQAAPAQERAGKGRTNMFRAAYEAPKDPKHQVYYEQLRKARLLERFSEALASMRLPKPLLIKFAGCDGTINAWYEDSDGTVTFCYEYVDDLWKTSRGAAERGADVDAVWEGSLIFILLHETSHALFALLKVPVLGREEDAADQVAAFLLLRAGEAAALRVLRGAAWMYLHDSKGRMPDESDFADVHGLDSQRFYNVLCMAYGSNHGTFKGMVDKGYLPKERAEDCPDEFRQVGFAVKQLIDPSIDVALATRIKAAHKARWEGTKTPGETVQSQPK
jgi:hypothetical protein